MILIMSHGEAHLDEGDLVRLEDGECTLEEQQLFREHLAACSECRAHAERLGRLGEAFSTVLIDVDDVTDRLRPGPAQTRGGGAPTLRDTPWHSRKMLRIGAVLVALLAVTMTVTPVRAWVAAQLDAVKGLFVSRSDQQGPTVTSVVSFVPAGPDFLIDFARPQSTGTLSIGFAPDSSATTRVLGGDGQDEVILLQTGFRVENRAASAASYELRLPRSVTSVEVRIGGATAGRYDVTDATTGVRWEIDLTRAKRE